MARSSAGRGVTLIDTIVATSLMLVVFLGIAAAFNLSISIVTNNKARGGAIALGNERMEYIRSLSYSQVGTVGGIPAGILAQSESLTLNGVSYIRRTLVQYVDDASDGVGAGDANSITADYKVVKVDVSWSSRSGARHIPFVTRFSPNPGVESSVPGGTLKISVVDSASLPLFNAQLRIVNASTTPASAAIDITTYTNASGTATFIGATSTGAYQITVSKTGYSTAQTYAATASNTSPNPGHLTVSANQTTTGTFAIDLVSTLNVNTYTIVGGTWTDTFGDSTRISSAINTEVSGNRLRFSGNQPWTLPGEVFSEVIAPATLSRWKLFSWNDTRPAETTITYHVYYPTESGKALVPDAVLPGNSAGFIGTSVDVGSIPAGTYPSLILEAYLVALNPSAPSPSIEDWSLTYDGWQGVAVPFALRGAKTIGSGPAGPVYKYEMTHTTNSSGAITIPNLEWDTYLVTVNGTSTGYDIASSCNPQPEALAPATSVTTRLYFATHTVNSLLVDVRSATSSALLPGAVVSLSRSGYSATSTTDSCGQVFFAGLTSGIYSLAVSKTGYTAYSSSALNVAGTSNLSVPLN